MIRALEIAGMVLVAVVFIAFSVLFYIYFTDADPGSQPRLKRAMVCWWYHRWHRSRDGSWGRFTCTSCPPDGYGHRRMGRLEREKRARAR